MFGVRKLLVESNGLWRFLRLLQVSPARFVVVLSPAITQSKSMALGH